METQYSNFLSESMEGDIAFKNALKQALLKMKASGKLVVSTGDVEVTLVKASAQSYLLVEKQEVLSVFVEYGKRSKPFSHEISSLQEDASKEIYASTICTLIIDEEAYQKKLAKMQSFMDQMNEGLGSSWDKSMLKRTFSMMGIAMESFSSSPYEWKNFLTFLQRQGHTASIEQAAIENNALLHQAVDKRLAEFGMIIYMFMECTKKYGFNQKNKFEFNDMDNHLWKQGNYLLMDEQNMSFVMDFQDIHNFTIYAAVHAHNGDLKKTHTAGALLKKVREEGSTLNDVDHVALRVQNGQTIFADNSLMYNLDFDLTCTKNVLVREGLAEVYYPVDINDFDYQLAYSQTRFGTSRLNFIMYALFTLGTGYSYDEEKGRFYREVPYVPGLLENFEEFSGAPEKLTELIYLYPKEMTKLDEKWLQALEMVVDRIKQDDPEVSPNGLPQGQSKESVLQYLEEVISHNKQNKKKLVM